MDIQEQLAYLRRRVARIEARYSSTPVPGLPPEPLEPALRPARYNVEKWLNGQEVTTPAGCHFESERIWERHRLHGTFEISELEVMPNNLLDAISGNEVPATPCQRWAFLDT